MARRPDPRLTHTMDLQERDSSYHRRLMIISGIVVVSMVLVVVTGQRYIRRDDPKMVGWKGEMELLPEITIEPEVIPAEAAPRPQPKPIQETTAISVAENSEFETTAPVEKPTEKQFEPQLDISARGLSESEARALSRPTSYSETYVILRTVKPKYPQHERERSIEGSVTVELLVDEQGMVAQAYALNLVGPQSFQDSALEAVRQFEFQPPVIDGERSTMWIKFVIKFRMQN